MRTKTGTISDISSKQAVVLPPADVLPTADVSPIDVVPPAPAVPAADVGGDAVIHRIDSAVHALDEVDLGAWSDAALEAHLAELSVVLCRVDAQLSRLADAVRSRGYAITEVDLPLAS